MAEVIRRRKRPTKSCLLCRKRKLKCDREYPCSNCRRSKTGSCEYVEGEGPSARSTTNATGAPQTPVSVVSGQGPMVDMEQTVLHHAQREHQSGETPASEVDLTEKSNPLAGTWHIYSNRPPANPLTAITSGFVHKTRFFGPSHWATSGVALTLDEYTKAAAGAKPTTIQQTLELSQKCKTYGRLIKQRRAPTWPCTITTTLPPRPLADALVECYQRSFESVQRILHMPTFSKDYDDLYNGLRSDTGFIMQVKLVLALGAVTYDDTFTLRKDATKWVYEAQCWVTEPRFKSRLVIQGLQTHALLIYASEYVGIGGDPTCISAAALLRKAVHMGLHRDPKYLPKKSLLSAEMRRRLWSAIVEMNVDSSLASGMAPMLSPTDFDAEPPDDLDDDQLMKEDIATASSPGMTETTVTVVLRESCMDRLAVVKYLNALHPHYTIDQTMHHDGKIRAAYRSALKKLQAAIAVTSRPERFNYQLRVVELVFCRYLLALHAPFFPASLHEAQYAFSRKVVVDCSLKVWSIVCPRTDLLTPNPIASGAGASAMLYRMLTCSSGHFGTVARHASHLLAVECRYLLQEQDSLGPLIVRQDLMRVIEEAKQWCLDSLEAGKVSIRGLQLLFGVEAQIKSIVDQDSVTLAAENMILSARTASQLSLPILERKAAELASDSMDNALEGYQLGDLEQYDLMDDWGFMTAEPFLLTTDGEGMNWTSNAQEPAVW